MSFTLPLDLVLRAITQEHRAAHLARANRLAGGATTSPVSSAGQPPASNPASKVVYLEDYR